jgi:uncharacterized FAD-dependent dehydrogenase
MFRIFEIKLAVGESETVLPAKIMKKLRARNECRITEWRIARRSLDARDKRNIRFVYAVDFELSENGNQTIRRAQNFGVKVEDLHEEAYVISSASDCVIFENPAGDEMKAQILNGEMLGRNNFHNFPLGKNSGTVPGEMQTRKLESEMPMRAWDLAGEMQTRVLAGEMQTRANSHNFPYSKNLETDHQKIKRPVIAGFGPCGIFAAYVMAKAGLRPIVIERGKPVDERALDVAAYWQTGELNENSNVLFGEGGAGAFSDGKLTTGIGDARKSFVLETLAGAGGSPDVIINAHPHIGTDVLRTVIKNLRNEIISYGGEVRFSTKLIGVAADASGKLSKVICENNIEKYEIETDRLVLAIGHSARDTYKMLLASGIDITQKPFSIGLRIEHEQRLINKAMYGDNADITKLPPAEYKLSTKCLDGRGVYTFCMCPGGEIISAASESGGVCSNGMSNHARNGKYANSAILTDVRTSDFASNHPLAGVEFQRKWERAAFEIAANQKSGALLPTETVEEFYSSESTLAKCLPNFAAQNIREALPVFGKKIRGFDAPDTRLCGPETRSSAPVRITRDKTTMQSNVPGIYPCGEGAGFAGGIMSAAVDGIKAAELILHTI